jgi:hypothetical protein
LRACLFIRFLISFVLLCCSCLFLEIFYICKSGRYFCKLFIYHEWNKSCMCNLINNNNFLLLFLFHNCLCYYYTKFVFLSIEIRDLAFFVVLNKKTIWNLYSFYPVIQFLKINWQNRLSFLYKIGNETMGASVLQISGWD